VKYGRPCVNSEAFLILRRCVSDVVQNANRSRTALTGILIILCDVYRG
jgi:hypothetical protein